MNGRTSRLVSEHGPELQLPTAGQPHDVGSQLARGGPVSAHAPFAPFIGDECCPQLGGPDGRDEMNAAQLEPAAVAPEAARPGWHGPQQYSAERAARQEFCRRIERGELTEVERRTLANLVYAVGYMVETPLRDDRLIECTARWTVTHEQYRALLPADGAL